MTDDGRAVGWRRESKRSMKEAATGWAGGSKIVVKIATESKTVTIPD